jgi:predicted CXXCH cytochrome family protein
MSSKFVYSFVLISFALCLASSAPASQAKQDRSAADGRAKPAVKVETAAPTRPSDPNLYSGTEACVTCHEDIGKSYEKSPHAKTELSNNGAAFKGCEGCHGPGKAHAEEGGDTTKIVSFKNLSRSESTKICLDCHQENEERANYLGSQHARNNVGCLDCHSSHKARTAGRLLKSSQPQLCNGCHQKAKADVSKPLHHKSNEGLTGCTNCHSTHGGAVRQPVPDSQSVPGAAPRASGRRPRQSVEPLAEVQVRTSETTAVRWMWLSPQPVSYP